MSNDTDDLTDIFLDISDDEEITIQTQQEGPSHAPLEGATPEEVVDVTRDGLEDAVDRSFEYSEGG